MPTITFYGASDDLVEVDGCKGADEFNADNWTADLVAPDGGQLAVSVWYGTSGSWHVGVGQVDESIPMPGWPMVVEQGTGELAKPPDYTAVLKVDAPEGTRLTNIRKA